ncbi:hypothetical protein LX64_01096 [Chitinophaga skermanii]|uniref:VOC domain-containing protein n=1 Tax=Chitinophaga skermanii TaxID=331697 RepID=A0A327QWV8_9BACT|nr:VOC family protein [Chitinophaga skermanii]RAJ08445.1 hypothetical protein LX64_01096 [Chitinophaga skermanii]
MATQIFVNLPVKDLEKSKTFYTALGFSINQQFSDEKAACIVISNDIYVMLLTEPFFQTFTKRSVGNAKNATAVINAISMENRDAVDAIAEKAYAAGATVTNETSDLGFMYSKSFDDLDGHIWEVFHMDMSAIPQQ